MDMAKYMTFEAVHRPLIEIDEDTASSKFGAERVVKCFKYGKTSLVRDNNGYVMPSLKTYLTLDETVQVGDEFDGQIVKSVDSFPENWDSTNQLYAVLTWKSEA